MKDYYDARAPEYDEWYLGSGRFTEREREGWDEELAELVRLVESLPPKRTLDVACGTGFLTRHLPGEVTGLDQSGRMLEVAAQQAPGVELVRGDALDLPFADRAFDRVFTAHFYGHLDESDRARFMVEAHRVSRELVIVDSSRARPDAPEDGYQERILNDGSSWEVLKRYFTGAQLVEELGGGNVLHDGRWFAVVRGAWA